MGNNIRVGASNWYIIEGDSWRRAFQGPRKDRSFFILTSVCLKSDFCCLRSVSGGIWLVKRIVYFLRVACWRISGFWLVFFDCVLSILRFAKLWPDYCCRCWVQRVVCWADMKFDFEMCRGANDCSKTIFGEFEDLG